jgi:hypothetical protein
MNVGMKKRQREKKVGCVIPSTRQKERELLKIMQSGTFWDHYC